MVQRAIGSLAKAAGVSPDTIRHYEKIGVLPKAERTHGGYRIYPENALERVLVVRRALQIGFTLAELSQVLRARDAGGIPCRQVFELARMKLDAIADDIIALRRTQQYLKKVLRDWERRMQEAGSAQRALLLHSLTDAPEKSAAPTKRLRRKTRP